MLTCSQSCPTIYIVSAAINYEARFNGSRAYRIWVSIEVDQRAIGLFPRRRANPARLRHSLGIEAVIGGSMETVGRLTIVNEWRRRSPHGSDWKHPWKTTREGNVRMWRNETRNGGM
jgi:hypothetical protein